MLVIVVHKLFLDKSFFVSPVLRYSSLSFLCAAKTGGLMQRSLSVWVSRVKRFRNAGVFWEFLIYFPIVFSMPSIRTKSRYSRRGRCVLRAAKNIKPIIIAHLCCSSCCCLNMCIHMCLSAAHLFGRDSLGIAKGDG